MLPITPARYISSSLLYPITWQSNKQALVPLPGLPSHRKQWSRAKYTVGKFKKVFGLKIHSVPLGVDRGLTCHL